MATISGKVITYLFYACWIAVVIELEPIDSAKVAYEYLKTMELSYIVKEVKSKYYVNFVYALSACFGTYVFGIKSLDDLKMKRAKRKELELNNALKEIELNKLRDEKNN